MAISVYKTFSAGEVLTASDLNSSFSQIVDNGEDLGFPATQAVDFNGQELILDADGDTSITVDTDDQIDFNLAGSDRFKMYINSSTMEEFRVISTDAGAAEGPFIVLERQSVSPSTGDLIGLLRFAGRNTTPTTISYGKVLGKLVRSTAGDEYGAVHIQGQVAGTLTTLLQVGTTGTVTDARSKFTADGSPPLEIDRLTDDGVLLQLSRDSGVVGNIHTNATNNRMAIGLASGVTLFITSGAGSPEGAISAVIGSLYLRTDGGAGTTLYVKSSGSGNTGWQKVTTTAA